MPILKPRLSKPLEEKVIATLHMSQYGSENEIYEKSLEAVWTEMEAKQAKAVERVNDATKAAAEMGTLGLEDTLRALANGQVEELVLSANMSAIDYSKREVKKILKEYEPGDDQVPVDAPPDSKIPGEVADQLIIRAINTGARIVFVKDDSLLKDAGGVGSILRYNINATASG